MKIVIIIPLMFLLLFSCVPKEEVVRRPVVPPSPVIPEPLPEPIVPVAPAEPVRYREVIKCADGDRSFFNGCGIDFLPFLKTFFIDIDNDGQVEMIAGTRDGTLRLYKKSGAGNEARWEIVEGYFKGLQVGAFAAPAAADIDNDGKIELIVGTGGFSSNSGRVLIYRNSGTPTTPVWEPVEHPEIRVGNDAVPAVADLDRDGRPDLIVGNSVGELVFFRNVSDGRGVRFEKRPGYFRGVRIGMYASPAITVFRDNIIIIAGNSTGRIYRIDRRQDPAGGWHAVPLKISVPAFSVPSFIMAEGGTQKDLVVSDGDGQLYYYGNRKSNYREWEEYAGYFSGRVFSGPACAPSVSEQNGRMMLVTGNINGALKLFEHDGLSERFPWKENKGFFKGISLHGFARGVMTEWRGSDLLITGQQDGVLRAFVRKNEGDSAGWRELQGFFGGIPRMLHPAPAVFDLDGDGKWELILGDAEGNIRGFKYEVTPAGLPFWTEVQERFSGVRVGRFATPALLRDGVHLYLFAGQQDGRMTVFEAEGTERPVFENPGFLEGIKVGEHSSPTAVIKNGLIEMSVGDYNGSLRHFVCRREKVVIDRETIR